MADRIRSSNRRSSKTVILTLKLSAAESAALMSIPSLAVGATARSPSVSVMKSLARLSKSATR